MIYILENLIGIDPQNGLNTLLAKYTTPPTTTITPISLYSQIFRGTLNYDPTLSYQEKANAVRARIAPYTAFAIFSESNDESDLVEMFTPTSIIVERLNAPIVHTMHTENEWFRVYTPEEYLNKKHSDLLKGRRIYLDPHSLSSAKSRLYDSLRITLAKYDFGVEPEIVDGLFRPYDETATREDYLHKSARVNRWSIGVDHFDPFAEETEVTHGGLTKGQKARYACSGIDKEYFKSVVDSVESFFTALNTLPPDMQQELLRLKEQQDLRSCPFCQHEYSNFKSACPICFEVNPDYAFTDHNPEWSGEDDEFYEA